MRHAIIAATAILATYSSLSFAADCPTMPKTIQAGKLTVAAYDYPPFTVVSAGGNVTGVDPNIVDRAAKANCLEVKYLVMEPAATIQSVVSGKADVAIGSWSRTEKRAQVLGLSSPTYLDPMGIFSREGSDTVASFENKAVGTVQGYQWVTDLQAVFGKNLKLYPNAVSLAQDLAAGRIEAAFDAYNYGVYTQKSSGGYKDIQIKLAKPDERIKATLMPSQATIIYTKENVSLGKALDESIASTRGNIVEDIEAAGFDKAITEVGEPRLVQ